MSKILRWLPALLLVMAAGACSFAPQPAPAPGSGPVPAEPVRRGPVLLALLVPRSAADANAAELGQALANAARMGIVELRDPGLDLRIYDTAGDPAIAAEAARRAVADGAEIILGPLFGTSTRAVGRVAAEAGLPVLSFSTDVTVAGGPVSVIGYAPEAEAERVMAFAAARGYREVAVFYPLKPYGDAALDAARRIEATTAIDIVAATPYEVSVRGIEDASASFARIVEDFGADAVLLPAGGKELQAVGAYLAGRGVGPGRVQYLGLGQWNSRASFAESALRGGWFPAPDPGAVAAFAGRYRARYGIEPPVIATLGNTAVRIAGQLVAAARVEGRRDPFSPEALTRPSGFQGALGPVRIDPDGIGYHGLAILEVAERDFVVIDPAPLALGAGF